MDIGQADDFIQGKFYSSDEDPMRRVSKSPKKNISELKIGGGTRIRDSILRTNMPLISIGSKMRQKDNQLTQLFKTLPEQKIIYSSEIDQAEDLDQFSKFLERMVKNKEQIHHNQQNQEHLESDESEIIPSSLESEYEEMKAEIQKTKSAKSYSQTFAEIANDINNASNKNHFDIAVLRKLDQKSPKQKCRWSGSDVLAYSLTSMEKAQRILDRLNDIRVWPKKGSSGHQRTIAIIRHFLKYFLKHMVYEQFMILCVILNTIVLAYDSHFNSANDANGNHQIYNSLNITFTTLFAVEMLLKVGALGFRRYLRDSMNISDSILVIMSIVELAALSINPQQNSGSAISAFRVIRIFRVLRVLRMMRLLRNLQSMQIIIGVIQRSLTSFIYIAMLLLLFVFIYAILGMQLFGKISFQQQQSRVSFEDFHIAFINVYIVLTMTNWHSILYDTMYFAGSVGGAGMKALAALYYVSFILIGNYILLNLFLAVLIDSFLQEGGHEKQIDRQENASKIQLEGLQQKSHLIKQVDDSRNNSKFVRRQTISRPLFDLLKSKASHINEGDGSMVSQGPFLPTISEKVDLLKLLTQATDTLPQTILSKFSEEDSSEIIAIISLEMTSQMDYLSNSRLLEISHKGNDKPGLFLNVYCVRSFYIFNKTSQMRRIIMRLITHRHFDNLIIFIIVTSSVVLAFETYYLNYPSNSIQLKVFSVIDILLTAAFTIEALLKMAALGMVFDKGSFLRYPWNIMDLFIVVTSLVDAIVSSTGRSKSMSQLKVLRLLRILRPLRLVTHSKAMQNIVASLFASLAGIANVLILLGVIFLMFAILGVSLLSNRLIYCSAVYFNGGTQNPYDIVDNDACINAHGVWLSYPQNFDNVGNAIQTLLVVSSLNNWDQLMYQAVDTSGEISGPIINQSPGYAYFYICFILVGAFFFLNFLIGVLFLNFKQVQQSDDYALLQTPQNKEDEIQQSLWRDILRLIIKSEAPLFIKSGFIGQLQRSLEPGAKLDNALTMCLCLNTIQMACYQEEASLNYKNVLEILNFVFTAIYSIEIILRAWCQGSFLQYLKKSTWNKFDSLIVFFSLLDIIITSTSNKKTLGALPQIIRLLRILRIARIFRLIGKFKGLTQLIGTVVSSLEPLFSVFALLIIFFFVFAILGVFLFKDVIRGNIIDVESGGYMGFSNFGLAMLMMFRLTTGEDWSNVYIDTQNPLNCAISAPNCVTPYAVYYFYGFYMLCSYIMLNMFVLIALEQFDKYYQPTVTILTRFQNDLIVFCKLWQEQSLAQDIQIWKVTKFLQNLPNYLKIQSPDILQMSLTSTDGVNISFNDLLFNASKYWYSKDLPSQQLDMQLFEMVVHNTITRKEYSTTEANPYFLEVQIKQVIKEWLEIAKNERQYSEKVCVEYEVWDEFLTEDEEFQ